MKKTGFRFPMNTVDLTIAAVVAVGVASFLLMIYSDLLWRNNFRRSVPMLDGIMLARISAAEGHIWMEELLKGNEAVRIDMVLGSYRQAVEAMDACLAGQSAIRGLSGGPPADAELRTQLSRLKWSLKQSEHIAVERWRNKLDNVAARRLDRQQHAAYHAGGLIGSTINMNLQETIGDKIEAQRRIFYTTLVLWAGILTGVCGLLFFARKRQARTEKALLDSQEKLRLLSSHLLSAQEKERRRISRELHDELGQSLTALKMQIGGIQRGLRHGAEVVAEDCENVRKYVDRIIEDVRRLSRDLSPSILEDLGLSAAIRWLGEDFAALSGIRIDVDVPDIDDLFDREGAIVIYRIFQESLTNMARHAGARHASIRVEKRPGGVRFVFKDGGRGFDPAGVEAESEVHRGLGLTAMHERARMLGGNLTVESSRGGGTRIAFVAPLRKGGPDGAL